MSSLRSCAACSGQCRQRCAAGGGQSVVSAVLLQVASLRTCAACSGQESCKLTHPLLHHPRLKFGEGCCHFNLTHPFVHRVKF